MTGCSVGRILCGLAAITFVVSVLLSVLPNPGTAVIVAGPPLKVNCGTFFVDTPYSGDDGCEGTVLTRMGLTFLVWLAAFPLGTVGLLLIRRNVRRQ